MKVCLAKLPYFLIADHRGLNAGKPICSSCPSSLYTETLGKCEASHPFNQPLFSVGRSTDLTTRVQMLFLPTAS